MTTKNAKQKTIRAQEVHHQPAPALRRHIHRRVALVIAALILINLATTNLETRYGWRGDFSFNAVTTQSETTKQILRDLKRPVKIYALFERGEEDQPCWANRCSAASDMVTWEQTPPSADPLLLTRFPAAHHQRFHAQNLIVYCGETDHYRVLTATDFVTLSVDTDSGSYNVLPAWRMSSRLPPPSPTSRATPCRRCTSRRGTANWAKTPCPPLPPC